MVFLVDCPHSENPVHVDHTSAVKKRIIKTLWVDVLCLAFLGLGEPACFHWELCLLVSGSEQIQLSSQVIRASRTAGSELISLTISLLLWQRLSFRFSLSTLGTKIFCIFSSSQIIVCTVPTLTSNCALLDGPYPRNSLFGQSTLVYWLPYSSHTSHYPS